MPLKAGFICSDLIDMTLDKTKINATFDGKFGKPRLEGLGLVQREIGGEGLAVSLKTSDPRLKAACVCPNSSFSSDPFLGP